MFQKISFFANVATVEAEHGQATMKYIGYGNGERSFGWTPMTLCIIQFPYSLPDFHDDAPFLPIDDKACKFRSFPTSLPFRASAVQR